EHIDPLGPLECVPIQDIQRYRVGLPVRQVDINRKVGVAVPRGGDAIGGAGWLLLGAYVGSARCPGIALGIAIKGDLGIAGESGCQAVDLVAITAIDALP